MLKRYLWKGDPWETTPTEKFVLVNVLAGEVYPLNTTGITIDEIYATKSFRQDTTTPNTVAITDGSKGYFIGLAYAYEDDVLGDDFWVVAEVPRPGDIVEIEGLDGTTTGYLLVQNSGSGVEIIVDSISALSSGSVIVIGQVLGGDSDKAIVKFVEPFKYEVV